MSAVATRAAVARRVRAICEGHDDRLLVLLGVATPSLRRDSGAWLRALRADYEDELELLVRVQHDATPEAGDDARAALLRRLGRLGLPTASVVASCAATDGRWCRQDGAIAQRWRLLETARGAAPVGGILVPWQECLAPPVTSRRVLADFGKAWAGIGTSVARLTDALLANDLQFGGIALDDHFTPAGAAPGSPGRITEVLDRLAKTVRLRRITAATRRTDSLRSRL
ncbi:hypothetical protein [Burkholderia glumae]|uniref:Uncharacterized protein n=2 Tax=Burkholderia glumae TaxID=337 RepID=A0AAP9XVJ8_BURGL|nr:hypothetical protein [Burkholderia glumae]AJY62806.1 hypothetical protein KS03_3924 [Burkholderia glumae LMG 2196 = ATCC 33617]KHJ60078.1 hypothetical protein NCPPB3923_25960 [Burkholderia glumae]MCM2484483.1 hypothetical protein [Burkholderia glumae]MCM2494851.1 hypothetical protein [Burkholderia glumae]MCM2510175.1 hypothetical protein [Burkholderia glumae]